MNLRRRWFESPLARWAAAVLLLVAIPAMLSLRLCVMMRCETGTVPVYSIVQILTVVLGIVGAALVGWVLARTLRNKAVETRFGTFPRDRYPVTYRALVALYAIGFAVMLIAAASAGSLFLAGPGL